MGARFYLLGQLRLQPDPASPQLPDLPPQPTARALLAYLLLSREQTHSPAALSALFWGEAPPASAPDHLASTLLSLRPLINAAGMQLESTPEAVRLSLGNAWLDVAALDRGLASPVAADRAAALDLYRAELLADWHDEWVIIQRELLRRRVLDAGLLLLRHYLAQRSWPEGIALADRLLAHDNLDPALHHLLAELLLGAGRSAEAQRHQRQYAQFLHDRFGIAPPQPII